MSHERLYEKWLKEPVILKILNKKPNDHSFFQITRELLGKYDRSKWIIKIADVVQANGKIGLKHTDFDENEQREIYLMILYFNNNVKEIIFASKQIRELTDEDINTLIKENHDLLGHPGIQKTYDRLRERYKIKRLFERIEEYVKHCDICQKNKLTRIRPKEEPVIPDTPKKPNDKIAMDILGPLPKTKRGNQYILSIHDELTKYLILVPLKDQQT